PSHGFSPHPSSPLLRRLLLPGHGALARPLPRTGVRVGALAANGQVPAVPDAAITADLHEALDVLGRLLAEIPLDFVLVLDGLTDPGHLVLGKILDARIPVDLRGLQDLARAGTPGPEDVGQANLDALVRGKVDACDTSHFEFLFSPDAVCA